jgi:hypothetical protein
MDWLAPAVQLVGGLGAWAPVVFILVYAATTVTLAPAFPQALVGGALFGLWQGTVYVYTVASVEMTPTMGGTHLLRKGDGRSLAARGQRRQLRRNERSIAKILSRRRWCRSSRLKVAPRKACTISSASAGPMTRAPRQRTFMSSCSTA